MVCIESSREGLQQEWYYSPDGRAEVIKRILEWKYKDVKISSPIAGKDERLIIGNYRSEDGSTKGVFVRYFTNDSEGCIEISAGKKRAEEIKSKIKSAYPRDSIVLTKV